MVARTGLHWRSSGRWCFGWRRAGSIGAVKDATAVAGGGRERRACAGSMMAAGGDDG